MTSDTTIPQKDFVPVVYTTQLASMKRLIGDGPQYQKIDEWIRTYCHIVDNSNQMRQLEESWARINEQLRNAYLDRMNMVRIAPQRSGKTWLGSQLGQRIIDEHLRIPEVPQVPGVRDLSWSYGPVTINREDGTAEIYSGSTHWEPVIQGDAVQLKEWLQRRGICRRASSCGLA